MKLLMSKTSVLMFAHMRENIAYLRLLYLHEQTQIYRALVTCCRYTLAMMPL